MNLNVPNVTINLKNYFHLPQLRRQRVQFVKRVILKRKSPLARSGQVGFPGEVSLHPPHPARPAVAEVCNIPSLGIHGGVALSPQNNLISLGD